jgi:DtxR family Mn-dependent transcriptional regulator
LSLEHHVARSKDIADAVGVSRPSVTGALQKLDKAGLIQYEPYGYVVLTEEGEMHARQLLLKHRATQDFLEVALGLNHERAESVASRVEQYLPADVLCRLVQFNNYYRQNPEKRYSWDPQCKNLCRILYDVEGLRTCHDENGRITVDEDVR